MSGNNVTAEATMKRTFGAKAEPAQTLQGGVAVEVVMPEHARIAEEAGARAATIADHVPANIHEQDSAPCRSYLALMKWMERTVSIPVMAKACAAHFNEREMQSSADDTNHINKNIDIPFACDCCNLREALQGILHGATMIYTKDIDNVSETICHVRSIMSEIDQLCRMNDDKLLAYAQSIAAPYELVTKIKQSGRLPVPLFAAGGMATPTEIAHMMHLGCDGIFVGSLIFRSYDPAKKVRAFVQAVTHYNNPKILAAITTELDDTTIGVDDRNTNL